MDVAQPEYLYRLVREPNDADYPAGPRNSGLWFLRLIQAPNAWDTTVGTKQVGSRGGGGRARGQGAWEVLV